MSDADLATRLAELQKDIDEGRLKPEDVRGDQLDGIEDGTYHAAVSGFEVLDDLQDYPGVVALKTMLMITSGEHGGRNLEIFMWDILKRDERKLGFLRSHFYNLGVTPLDFTQIQNGSQMFHALSFIALAGSRTKPPAAILRPALRIREVVKDV